MSHRLVLICSFAFAVQANLATADVILVPQEFATIQDAVTAAEEGDVVVVSPGVYEENISFLGKAVVVTMLTSDEAVVDATIIQGSDWGSVVTFENGEGPGSVLAGITVRDGLADVGGGVGCFAAGPTILKCVIADNFAGDAGGGIYIDDGDPVVAYCSIEGNRCTYVGGGVYSSGGDPLILGCQISDNRNLVEGEGGGAFCVLGNPQITGCTVSGNVSSGAGGGIACNLNQTAMITNCMIYRNRLTAGGGISLWRNEGRVTIRNCTIVRNQSTSSDSHGLWALNDGFLVEDTLLSIGNSILAGNGQGGHQAELIGPALSATIRYSDVQGGPNGVHGGADVTFGAGNISASPLFANPAADDYRLTESSPCVNAGNPAFTPAPNETDFEGEPRLQACAVDMGADESPYQTNCE